MNIKFVWNIVMLTCLLALAGCSVSPNSSNSLAPNVSSASKADYIRADGIDPSIIIEKTDYYEIGYTNFSYFYCIFDKNHNIVKSEGPLNRQPHLSLIDNTLIKFTLQTGTGLGTQWGYFYDIQANRFSQIFTCIYDQYNGKVAYGEVNGIIISDIFDKEKYHYEISSFKYPLSEVAEPIVNVKFVNSGTNVQIVYLTGTDYKEVTEIIDLI